MALLPQHNSTPNKSGLWGKAGSGVGSRAGEREGRNGEGSGWYPQVRSGPEQGTGSWAGWPQVWSAGM